MAGRGHIGFRTLANVLTLSRIPFGIAFWFVADRPTWARAIMVVGGVTDLVDGAVARRRGQAGRNGVVAWLDPVVYGKSSRGFWHQFREIHRLKAAYVTGHGDARCCRRRSNSSSR